jgi:dienelactone hydrolase
MDDSNRRDFMRISTGGMGAMLLAGTASLSRAEIPIPPIIGRSSRDMAGRRALLYELLGDLPDRLRPITAKKRDQKEHDGYILEDWLLDLNGIEPAAAYLARPKTLEGRAAAILYNHSHGGGYDIGKREFIEGRPYLQTPPYAKALTDQGYVALSIDHWCFGERQAPELETFKGMIWQGHVLWGMMVYDSLKALDWLISRSDVDGERVGTLGMSMGSAMAQWIGALDERVKVVVDICCLVDYHSLMKTRSLRKHGIYFYVPSLLKHFTAADINALIAPRPHLGIVGNQDALTPFDGLAVIDRELTQAYAEAGHPERWRMLRYDVGHQETAAGRSEALAFLREFL